MYQEDSASWHSSDEDESSQQMPTYLAELPSPRASGKAPILRSPRAFYEQGPGHYQELSLDATSLRASRDSTSTPSPPRSPRKMPLSALYEAAFGLGKRKKDIELNEEFKRRVYRLIKSAMNAGQSTCVVTHLRQSQHYTCTPLPETGANKPLDDCEVLLAHGWIRVHGAAAHVVQWLLSLGVEWDLVPYSQSVSIMDTLILSGRADLIARWTRLPDAQDPAPAYAGHPSRDPRGKLISYWDSVLMVKTTRQLDGAPRWHNIVRGAIRCGQIDSIIACLWEGADYFQVPNADTFTSQFPGQLVPLAARQLPSRSALPPDLRSNWAIDEHLKEVVAWLQYQGLLWYLSFVVFETKEGEIKRSNYAYLTAVYLMKK